MTNSAAPIRLAVLNDYEVVVNGLAKMLERYTDRVKVVELSTMGDDSLIDDGVEIVLFDTFGQSQGEPAALDGLLHDPRVDNVVVYTWNFQPDVVRRSLEAGVKGYLSKTLPAGELVAALQRVHEGEVIVSAEVGSGPIAGEWPGREEGLTPREAEVLALITQGLSNNEIAEQTHLSINSVKSYIRTGYRKIGVTSRSQAVLWGVRHGFEPDHGRIVTEAAYRR